MTIKTIQDFLPLVERPSRYLGSEINAVKKEYDKIELSICLAFPDLYEIGTSHFGLQILYDILNQYDNICAERVFAPGPDMEKLIRDLKLEFSSLETQRPINKFDIVGFSLLYELNYTNILTILDLAKIPFLSCQRDEKDPILIAGGPCAFNPEPIADFFDAIVIGDGEQVIAKMSEVWMEFKSKNSSKQELLKEWASIEGIYVPMFFDAYYKEHENQTGKYQTLVPKFSFYQKVKRAVLSDLENAPFPVFPIVPYGRPVHDRLRLEIARGCSRGCRFCQAGMIYRPVRERSVEKLLDIVDKSINSSGYEDISLLSLSTGDYGCLTPLMENLMTCYKDNHIAVSLPSIRAGRLTPELMSIIKQVRKTGFTIAPEAGSQRLRDVINKGISEQEIIDTVKNAFSLGWQVIKLYFMIGLPTETDEDLQAIVDLVLKLKQIKVPNKRKGKINVSVTTFIPKAHTVFQWMPQISLQESKSKIDWLKEKIGKISGIQLKWQDPKVSFLEGLWARGDRRFSSLLIRAYEKGCRFDGWSDQFRYDLWIEALEECNIDPFFYINRERTFDEPLPWDHIDSRISELFLKKELEKAFNMELTEDCRSGVCKACGICDFKKIQPITFETCKNIKTKLLRDNSQRTDFKKVKVVYSKKNQAKYFGHLELVNIILRAVRRAGIELKYSQGFHPMPKLSFDNPLPLGMESLCEYFYLTVQSDIDNQDIVKRLNRHLVFGIDIISCEDGLRKSSSNNHKEKYKIILKDYCFKSDELNDFMERPDFIITRKSGNGKIRNVDLKEIVDNINLFNKDTLYMVLENIPGSMVRPFEILKNIFSIPEEKLKLADIIKMPLKMTDSVDIL